MGKRGNKDELGVRTGRVTRVPRNVVCELEWAAIRDYEDPWSELGLTFEVTDPEGTKRTVPAFWSGRRSWRLRYSSSVEGKHEYRSHANDASSGLDGLSGEITITSYRGSNPLLMHGGPTVSADGRHLAHADGTPFFWLSDSWLAAMTARFRWPDIFQALADDRAAKGFTVVQLVAGLVPEFVPFSRYTASEGGQAWLERGHGQINPDYYSIPDLKIDYLVGRGIVPCIVGGWGHYATMLGSERVSEHWRYLVARYSAYPVVWHIAGETDLVGLWEYQGTMRDRLGEASEFFPRPGDPARPMDDNVTSDPEVTAEQVRIWEDASKLVHRMDPFSRVRTVEALQNSSGALFSSRDSFDLDMLQTGHSGTSSVPLAMKLLRESLRHGDKPVLDGECTFEGIFDSNWQDVQRFQFWSSVLSGAAGYSYGTMAISLFNSKDDPHLPLSRVSMHYWEDAIDWLGSKHVGVGKQILERFPWWELTPAPEIIDLHSDPDNWFLCYAATLQSGTIVVYIPSLSLSSLGPEPSDGLGSWSRFSRLTFSGLRVGARYRVTYINPRTGEEYAASYSFVPTEGQYKIESSHFWNAPTGEDWIMVLDPNSSPAD